MDAPAPYAWASITWLLDKGGVSWSYFVGPHTCIKRPQCGLPFDDQTTVPAQNPLPGFRTVRESPVAGSLNNVRFNDEYFAEANAGSLPSVSWVMPTRGQGEHPSDRIANGQRWVSRVVNAAMQGPDAARTAVFLVWDDWGGFYDHVKPHEGRPQRLRDPRPGHPDQPLRRPEPRTSTTSCSRSTPS